MVERAIPGEGRLQRWALGVEYDGGAFVGWQRQKDGPSVQEALESALGFVAGHEVGLHCAGRTDAGVHATGQVIHFDTSAFRDERNWLLGANSRLPGSVSLLWAQRVTMEFHARFSARARRYRYVIANQSLRPAIHSGGLAWWRYPLNAPLMHQAAQAFVGTHDFSSLRAAACQARSAVKTVHAISVQREGRYVMVDVHANAFLHHMVRNIAGVLIAIGQGKREVGWAREVLEARDRRASGITAPAGGLYLVGVDYAAEFGIPLGDRIPVPLVFAGGVDGFDPRVD